MKNLNEKIENLRNLLNSNGVRYDELERLTYRNENVPSISTLRKYGLLIVVREETYEDTMTDEESEEMDCEEMNDWDWDDDRNLWVYTETVRFYGIK